MEFILYNKIVLYLNNNLYCDISTIYNLIYKYYFVQKNME